MSDKTVVQRLFIKPGCKFLLVNAPRAYQVQKGELPKGASVVSKTDSPVDLIQVFVANRQELEAQLPKLKKWLTPQGSLWVSYYKGTARIKTDINRDTIYAYAQTIGLQGVAMISLDEDWSALRLKLIEK